MARNGSHLCCSSRPVITGQSQGFITFRFMGFAACLCQASLLQFHGGAKLCTRPTTLTHFATFEYEYLYHNHNHNLIERW